MSAVDNIQKLQKDLQNDLTTANQLLRLILMELEKIKLLTSSGAELDTTIKQNASMVVALANLQKTDIGNLARITRDVTVVNHQSNQHNVLQQLDSEGENMDDSQD